MNKFFAAVALTVAFPAMTHAQAVAAAPKEGCCAKMKDMAKMDHKTHDMKAGVDPHAGHVMAKPTATAPQADVHQNHK